MNNQKYSHSKTSLSQEEKETLLNYNLVKKMIKKNHQKIESVFLELNLLWFIPINILKEQLDFTGSIICDKKPVNPFLDEFFRTWNRLRLEGKQYFSHGKDYFIALDDNIFFLEKVNILFSIISEGLACLKNLIHEDTINLLDTNDKLWFFGLLDYIKHSLISVFNTLISQEKLGIFNFDNKKYQQLRAEMQLFTGKFLQEYYNFIVNKEAFEITIKDIDDLLLTTNQTILFLQEKNNKFLQISYPECNHPLTILSSVYLMSIDHPSTDIIIAMPSGWTEWGYALQYVYNFWIHKNNIPKLCLFPLSLHSIKQEFWENQSVPIEEEISQRLKHHIPSTTTEGKNLFIIDDNSSTWKTISLLINQLYNNNNPKSIAAAVIEADIKRSIVDKNSEKRTHIADHSLYQYSTNILPISTTLFPKNDLKEIKGKEILKNHYHTKIENASSIEERIENILYFDVINIPAKDILKNISDENDIIRSFRHTFLSNFYPCQIFYQNKEYPSVEHCYLSQKFDLPKLNTTVSEEEKQELNNLLKSKGQSIPIEDFTNLYTNPIFPSWNIKSITTKLVERGYEDPTWNTRKLPTMINLVRQKFSKHNELKEQLLATQDKYLLEGNDRWDTYRWFSQGIWSNYLWRILMTVRAILQEKIKIPMFSTKNSPLPEKY